MKLREQILFSHTKLNATQIAQWIGQDKKRFDDLMQLFLHDEYNVVQRSAWVLSMCAENFPELVDPYIGEMLEQCAQPGIHSAVKRNVTRIFQSHAVPKIYHERFLNLCFEWLIDQKETIAVRCFSMGILANLCQPYPEMKNELRNILEDALEYQEVSAAFKNRARRMLKILR